VSSSQSRDGKQGSKEHDVGVVEPISGPGGHSGVERVEEEARREIRRVTAQSAWQNHWNGDGHVPDYSAVRKRFERMLEMGHADRVVSLSHELVARGMRQARDADDEGETATALGAVLATSFEAVNRSSLSGSERLMFGIEVELLDESDVIGDDANTVLRETYPASEWSVVADLLAKRLWSWSSQVMDEPTSFWDGDQRERLTTWLARALESAGRGDEILPLLETEARTTGSFDRVVNYLLARADLEGAARWAREGISATRDASPAMAAVLLSRLGAVAEKSQNWEVAAAYAAWRFFSEHPSRSTFDELMRLAREAGVEGPVRSAALGFLETGLVPYRLGGVCGTELIIDVAWPLPVPAEIIELLEQGPVEASGVRPTSYPGVLLEMAIAAERPDEVLERFDRMSDGTRSSASGRAAWDYADQVAAAIKDAYPDRALAILLGLLQTRLASGTPSCGEAAASILKRSRLIHDSLDRGGEWVELLESLRSRHGDRARLMAFLDGVESST
jgi:uncharacterized Zn finger protein